MPSTGPSACHMGSASSHARRQTDRDRHNSTTKRAVVPRTLGYEISLSTGSLTVLPLLPSLHHLPHAMAVSRPHPPGYVRFGPTTNTTASRSVTGPLVDIIWLFPSISSVSIIWMLTTRSQLLAGIHRHGVCAEYQTVMVFSTFQLTVASLIPSAGASIPSPASQHSSARPVTQQCEGECPTSRLQTPRSQRPVPQACRKMQALQHQHETWPRCASTAPCSASLPLLCCMLFSAASPPPALLCCTPDSDHPSFVRQRPTTAC